MKKVIAIAFCLFAAGNIYAQNNAAPKKNPTPAKPAAAAPKPADNKPAAAKPATTTAAAPQKGTAHAHKAIVKKSGPGVAGYILDAKKHPLDAVQAFIYGADSTIIASGYTDATGHFETNAVKPGTYNVKVRYPEANAVLVTGVVIKTGLSPLNMSMNPPSADTTVPYTVFAPLPEKKTPGAKKK